MGVEQRGVGQRGVGQSGVGQNVDYDNRIGRLSQNSF
jgi:hypothetical protein